MKRAKAAGIDAFALNIAKDTYTEAQLNYAYESAGNNGMKLFLSFDYNNGDIYFGSGDVSQVAKFITEFGSKDAQLKVDNKVFVSSFNGDDSDATRLDPQAIRNAAGIDLFIAPNFHPGKNTDISGVDGALSWSAWDSNGANRAPDANANITTSQSDATYTSWLGSKAYIAPVSPWFFTNYASKAWVFPSNLLWFRRWNEILALGPRFVEIVTWNDYGESHYIGAPPSEDHDSVSQAWSANMPHDGWLDMGTPLPSRFPTLSRFRLTSHQLHPSSPPSNPAQKPLPSLKTNSSTGTAPRSRRAASSTASTRSRTLSLSSRCSRKLGS
jgi:hypothetical protein